MKELMIGDKKVRVRATPLALLYYKQEFHSDLLGDLTRMKGIEKDSSKLDTVFLLQITWAMTKADAYPQPFPSFEGWLVTFDEIDLTNPTFLAASMEEVANGFLGKNKRR
ncbi:hypothetical protein [Desulfosporosinus sp.]|uniref:hypothetical protein n=1 Tax=Desulfosporosinus sp. TaxID=157907 RepID=UPI0025B9D7A0|nr:hypothetical protein [Desulfosporosinus sp.]MBC2722341.1 hypothetical protein [Desulfosporosinus sp.]MBC2728625.1 hypothetical protein [Desulfosporosinus sp.]